MSHGHGGLVEVSGTHHKDIQLKCFKKRRVQELTASNRASLIKHLISDKIMLMRVSKPKANTLNICCDVLVHNCQFDFLSDHSPVCYTEANAFL